MTARLLVTPREIQDVNCCRQTSCGRFSRLWRLVQAEAGQSFGLSSNSGAAAAKAGPRSRKSEADQASQLGYRRKNHALTTYRARVKQTIAELEKRVEMLSEELHLTRLENASLQEKNQLAPPGTIPLVAPPMPVPGPEEFPEGTAAIMDVVVRQKTQPPPYVGMGSQFANNMVVTGPISNGSQESPGSMTRLLIVMM
jgi:hypothetical protein